MRNLFLFPLRLLVGWGLSPRLLGLIAATMLVLLRVSIGWHFYSEGMDKRAAGNWSAAPFLANARGPLAEHFRKMVWDAEGKLRLERGNTHAILQDYQSKAAAHYGFDDQQTTLANASLKEAMDQYDWVMEENAIALEEYRLGQDRMKKLETDGREKQMRDGVSSMDAQRATIRREWKRKASVALQQVDSVWDHFENTVQSIATDDQTAHRGPFRLVKPRTHHVDTSLVDGLLPYFDIVVGLCLLVGLFTPLAGLAAAGFLFSIFLSQYPPITGPSSSMYQLIESMACLVLAATGAGRFAGLDFFLHLLVRKHAGIPSEPS